MSRTHALVTASLLLTLVTTGCCSIHVGKKHCTGPGCTGCSTAAAPAWQPQQGYTEPAPYTTPYEQGSPLIPVDEEAIPPVPGMQAEPVPPVQATSHVSPSGKVAGWMNARAQSMRSTFRR